MPGLILTPRTVLAQSDQKPIVTRVLIRRPDNSLDADTIVVTGDGEFALTDGRGEQLMKVPGQRLVKVGREGDAFWVQVGDSPRRTGLAGPIKVNGTGDGAPLRNQAQTSGEPTAFRGALEVVSSPDGRVALVNVLGLHEYLYGVVTKELPASFGLEPLKAQAIAARTYTMARAIVAPHKAQSADICDTQHCQAFGGLTGELPAGRTAVDATRGQVLLSNGAVFQPYYSSACGGHTESASRIFGMPEPDADGDGVEDGEIPGGTDLKSDAGALKFFKNGWDSNCTGSNRYRWSYSWDAGQLKTMVQEGIARFEGTQTLSVSSSDARLEQIENVSIPERGSSGRAIGVRFEAPGVSWTVKRDWGIRNFLKTPDGAILPSSAIALEVERGADRKVTKLTAYGAGWGHGAGMCQWGTRGLAARGLAGDAILEHYYPFADLGDAAKL